MQTGHFPAHEQGAAHARWSCKKRPQDGEPVTVTIRAWNAGVAGAGKRPRCGWVGFALHEEADPKNVCDFVFQPARRRMVAVTRGMENEQKLHLHLLHGG